jgi:hypothetical protein
LFLDRAMPEGVEQGAVGVVTISVGSLLLHHSPAIGRLLSASRS